MTPLLQDEWMLYRNPTEALALTCWKDEDWRFATGARAASLKAIQAGASYRVVDAHWQTAVLATTPSVGVQLVLVESTPTSETITPLATIESWTPKTGPQRGDVVVTQQINNILAATELLKPTTPYGGRQIGTRIKGDGLSAPKLYMSVVTFMWALG